MKWLICKSTDNYNIDKYKNVRNIDPIPNGRAPIISTGFSPVSSAVTFFFFFFQFRTETVLAFRISNLQNSAHKLIFSAWPVIRNPPNKFQCLGIIRAKRKEHKEKKNVIFPLFLTGHIYVAFLCALRNNQTHCPCFVLPFQGTKLLNSNFLDLPRSLGSIYGTQ